MKYTEFNPSTLEVMVAEVIKGLKAEISSGLDACEIASLDANTKIDNPEVSLKIKDKDGDSHSVLLRIIHIPEGEEE